MRALTITIAFAFAAFSAAQVEDCVEQENPLGTCGNCDDTKQVEGKARIGPK